MVDTELVLRAIAFVESDNGRNNCPRFEAAFAPRGEPFTVQGRIVFGTGKSWNAIVAQRWHAYGMASACSYGRFQVLYHRAADLGFDGAPWDLWDDETNEVVARENLAYIRQQGARSVIEVADAWNSGTHRDGIIPSIYISKVLREYNNLARLESMRTTQRGRD